MENHQNWGRTTFVEIHTIRINNMEGVSIVETAVLKELINKIENLEVMVSATLNQLKDSRKPYLSTEEVRDMTGFGKNWVQLNKNKIGFSKPGKELIFKRSDVDEFMSKNYFKISKNKQ
ncbi:helix-turn-helix domain-containing protein [Pedobacter kyonggii]|uniref:DNA-binding protein n=1 Tax=Pedobacter kyonggii TaxID=1926871 RepID=A0A4Q9H649_9SPHI|nr:helix-turn-helix domain-containing protein [Pedobacter kyonggii]TBO35946.1 DNA-binding protein [Pedobacter kyonggii]